MEQNLEGGCWEWEKQHQLEELPKRSPKIVKVEPHSLDILPQRPPQPLPSTRILSDAEDSSCSSAESTSRKRTFPCSPKKCGARYYKTKFDMAWIQGEPFKGVIVPVKNDPSYFRCLICEKNVSCSHQGIYDVKRHVSGKGHRALQERKAGIKVAAGSRTEQESTEDSLMREAEIKFTTFLAENNIPFAAANHLAIIIRQSFLDSWLAQSFACDETRALRVLNDVIAPGLLSDLVADMKSSVFSLCVEGSNYQDTPKKWGPLTVRIIDSKRGRVCCKVFDMCIRKVDTAEGILTAVANTMEKHSIPWGNCVGFGVDNASVNVGKQNSVKTLVHYLNANIYFMACPCQVAHDAASHATSAFCTFVKIFDVEELLIDLYYWFDYSSKMTNLYGKFSQFVDSDYRQMIKFLSVEWLGMATGLDRLILQFDSLRSYFLPAPDVDGTSKSRLKRLVKCFEDPMTEIYCLFLQASVPSFLHFNLLLQREDPVIHLLHDAIVDLTALLLSRVFAGQVVHAFMRNPDASLPDLTSKDCQIPDSSLYVGISVRGKLKSMLERGDIDLQRQHDFFEAVRRFHQAAVKYALDVLPVHDEVLKHARVFNFFEKQKHGFESVLFMVERFNAYLRFTKKDLACLEQEFVTYQVTDLEQLPIKAREEAAIKVNCSSGEVTTYRMDVIWFHLEHDFIVRDTHRSKFFLLSKIAKVLFTLLNSNADEERVFSRATKNRTKFHPSLSHDRTLLSMLMFQTNRPRCKLWVSEPRNLGAGPSQAPTRCLAEHQQPKQEPSE